MSLSNSNASETFAAKVAWKDHRKQLEFASEMYLQHWLNRLEVGDSLSVTIRRKKPLRTGAQNRYYWGAYLPLIAAETGEDDLDSLHELFRGMFLTETIAEVLGHKVRIKKSTTELSVNEFMEYVESIERFTGIMAPPAENWGL